MACYSESLREREKGKLCCPTEGGATQPNLFCVGISKARSERYFQRDDPGQIHRANILKSWFLLILRRRRGPIKSNADFIEHSRLCRDPAVNSGIVSWRSRGENGHLSTISYFPGTGGHAPCSHITGSRILEFRKHYCGLVRLQNTFDGRHYPVNRVQPWPCLAGRKRGGATQEGFSLSRGDSL